MALRGLARQRTGPDGVTRSTGFPWAGKEAPKAGGRWAAGPGRLLEGAIKAAQHGRPTGRSRASIICEEFLIRIEGLAHFPLRRMKGGGRQPSDQRPCQGWPALGTACFGPTSGRTGARHLPPLPRSPSLSRLSHRLLCTGLALCVHKRNCASSLPRSRQRYRRWHPGLPRQRDLPPPRPEVRVRAPRSAPPAPPSPRLGRKARDFPTLPGSR